jgi:putative folate metabolism gamma-glutamate ligase
MIITPVRTPKLSPGSPDLLTILDEALPEINDGGILAITSKIVSICEGSVVPLSEIDKHDLVIKQSERYLPPELTVYGHSFTITNNTLIPTAGIDESNGDGYYILWPRDSQRTANEVRQYLKNKHGLTHFGVVITDSTCTPMRRGTVGIALAHSGFNALRNYVGKPDLFGKEMAVTQANVSGGLAAASVVAMGEGTEQTPLCLLSDLPNIEFQDRDPSPDELALLTIEVEDDLFAPFLTSVQWLPGEKNAGKPADNQ